MKYSWNSVTFSDIFWFIFIKSVCKTWLCW
jgi:hypothetical protein